MQLCILVLFLNLLLASGIKASFLESSRYTLKKNASYLQVECSSGDADRRNFILLLLQVADCNSLIEGVLRAYDQNHHYKYYVLRPQCFQFCQKYMVMSCQFTFHNICWTNWMQEQLCNFFLCTQVHQMGINVICTRNVADDGCSFFENIFFFYSSKSKR